MLLDSPPVPGLNVLSAAADSKNGVVYWLMEYDTQDYTFTEGNPPTEVVAGSGKTTMFNSVLGQITPDAGRIEAFGLPAPVALNQFLRMRVIEDERDDQNRRTNPRSQGNEPGVAQVDLPDD